MREDEGVDDVAQESPRVREAISVEEHADDERAGAERGEAPGENSGVGSNNLR
jgi:hypothetical protein